MTRRKVKQEIDMPKAVLTMIKANIMAYVVTAIFVLLGSIILTYTNASPKVESMIVIIGIVISAFLAGYDTATVDNKNGYKWGAIGGSLYFIIFLVLGTMINKLNNVAPSMVFLLAFLVIMSSSVAGMFSVNRLK